MNPGKYRHKIKFLKRNSGKDDYGEPVDTWEVFKESWASKNPILGKEFFAAFSTDSHVDVKFNARYYPGITEDMRIQHGTEVYEIIGTPIDVNSMHKELLCYCRMVK